MGIARLKDVTAHWPHVRSFQEWSRISRIELFLSHSQNSHVLMMSNCLWMIFWMILACLRLKLGCFRGFLGHCHGFHWAQLLLLARANLGIAPSPENKWNSSMGQSLFLLPYFGGIYIDSPAMSAMFGYRVPRFWLIAIYIIYKWSCRESLDYIPND